MENESTLEINLKNAKSRLEAAHSICSSLIKENTILKSRVSQFESTIKEMIKESGELLEETFRLKKIIAQELNENDELGSEHVFVRILKDEIRFKEESYNKLGNINILMNEKLKIATEALEFYSKESSYYVNGAWDIKNHIDDSDLEQKIIYQELISVGGKRAREALDKIKDIEK